MRTFKELAKQPPKLNYFLNNNIHSSFWEDLYQLFKARMLEEMQATKKDGE